MTSKRSEKTVVQSSLRLNYHKTANIDGLLWKIYDNHSILAEV